MSVYVLLSFVLGQLECCFKSLWVSLNLILGRIALFWLVLARSNLF